MEKSAIKSAIYEHPEFATFIAGMNAHFAAWRQASGATPKALQAGCHPKEVIAALAEGLLAHYARKPLIDRYDIYQHLTDYWAETMQDDCYLIAADGWRAETTRIIEKDKKGKEKDKGWTCDLIRKALIVGRYFGKEQAAIDQLAAELEGVAARLTEMQEEHGGDEGAFADFDKVNKANVTARLKEIAGDKDAKDEAVVLNDWLKRNGKEAELKKRLKEAEAALDAQAYARYPKLTESEIKTLVVDDKWLVALDAAIHGEMDRVSQQLTQRVKELAERYETPQPQMVNRVAELEAKVNRHLDLLTGKKRLPGFSGEWEVKRLGELAEIRGGGTPSTTQSQFWDGDVPWCTPTDITGLNGFKYLSDTRRKISQAGLKASSAEIIPTKSVVMTSRATIGACAINRVPVSTNQGFKNFTPFENVDAEFLYYLLLTQKQGFISLCGGSTFLEIGKAQLAAFELRVPTTKAEQIAIAAILSDMDAEIAALEAKLAKARQLKQGMMQELLTGRIRLV